MNTAMSKSMANVTAPRAGSRTKTFTLYASNSEITLFPLMDRSSRVMFEAMRRVAIGRPLRSFARDMQI
jgi:hypothetical protein